jgi:hypothetical protein
MAVDLDGFKRGDFWELGDDVNYRKFYPLSVFGGLFTIPKVGFGEL